jgi:hypothetical protein
MNHVWSVTLQSSSLDYCDRVLAHRSLRQIHSLRVELLSNTLNFATCIRSIAFNVCQIRSLSIVCLSKRNDFIPPTVTDASGFSQLTQCRGLERLELEVFLRWSDMNAVIPPIAAAAAHAQEAPHPTLHSLSLGQRQFAPQDLASIFSQIWMRNVPHLTFHALDLVKGIAELPAREYLQWFEAMGQLESIHFNLVPASTVNRWLPHLYTAPQLHLLRFTCDRSAVWPSMEVLASLLRHPSMALCQVELHVPMWMGPRWAAVRKHPRVTVMETYDAARAEAANAKGDWRAILARLG